MESASERIRSARHVSNREQLKRLRWIATRSVLQPELFILRCKLARSISSTFAATTLANTFLSELEPSHSDRNSGNAEHHSQAPIGTSSGQKSNRGDHQSDLEEDFR